MAKKKKTRPKPAAAGTTFEKSLEQLEAIVSKLESGQLPLADSLDQYEQGVGHLKACYQMLQQAERQIALVGGLDAQGKPQTQPFDDAESSGSLDKKHAQRSRRRTAKSGPSSAGQVDDPSTLF